ncbi:YqgQ family protein, partial [Listeria fleischmannii]
MKSVYDVAQLLKKYGIIIYLGKREYDIEMM